MKIHIVDYGLSNLLSVQRAVQKLGHTPMLTFEAEEIRTAQAIILPGVGAFKDGMAGLSRLDIPAALHEAAAKGTPVLGICLGMQMLFDYSEEFGHFAGLGLIPGGVKRIPVADADGRPQRVPQVGWNALLPPAGEGFATPLLTGTAPGSEVYFVHSYEAHPVTPAHRLADTLYGGRRVCAAATDGGSVYGTQFHPEKSGEIGLQILAAFLRIANKGV